MSAASLAVRAPVQRGRGRFVWILALWAVAAVLVLVQYLHIQQVYADIRQAYRFGGELVLPSGRWRFWGIVIPLLLATAAVIRQFRCYRGIWRTLAGLGLTALVPIWLVAWVTIELSGPDGVDSVRLSDGRRFILAQELGPDDPAYGLYESAGLIGIYWRLIDHLDYWEDARFGSNVGLTLSPDEKWLLATRGGVWTDCFGVEASRLVDCAVKPYPNWNDRQFEEDMRLRSTRITLLTGLRPPGDGPDP